MQNPRWQAICHNKKHVFGRTKCTETLSFAADDDLAEAATLYRIKHWCNCAFQFASKETHMAFWAALEDLPDEDIIESNRLMCGVCRGV